MATQSPPVGSAAEKLLAAAAEKPCAAKVCTKGKKATKQFHQLLQQKGFGGAGAAATTTGTTCVAGAAASAGAAATATTATDKVG